MTTLPPVTTSLTSNFFNLNSGVAFDPEDEKYALSKMGFLYEPFYKTPIYFVNEHLMDQIYPLGKLTGLDPRCVNEIIGSFVKRFVERKWQDFAEEVGIEDEVDKFIELWESLSNCVGKTDRAIVALGFYEKEVESREISIIKSAIGSAPSTLATGKSSIFLCLERLRNNSDPAHQVESLPQSLFLCSAS